MSSACNLKLRENAEVIESSKRINKDIMRNNKI